MSAMLDAVAHSPLIIRLGWTLLHFVWEGAAVAGVLAVLLWLLARTSSSIRYLAAVSALLLMVLSPVVTFQFIGVPAVLESSPLSVLPTAAPKLPDHQIAQLPNSPVTRLPDGPVVQHHPRIDEGSGVAPHQPRQAGGYMGLQPVLPYFVALWLMGVVLLALYHLGGFVAIQRLKSLHTHPATGLAQSLLLQLGRRMKISRPVKLLTSTLVQTPVVLGYLRPVILLPASILSGLSTQQLEAILAHELAHIRRHDYLINLLQALVETLLFYHPAVWWVSQKIRHERENCCDDTAARLCGDPLLYAQALLSLEELRTPTPTALALAATGGSMLTRIRRLLNLPPQTPSRKTRSLTAALIILSSLLLLFTVIKCAKSPASTTAPVSANSLNDSQLLGRWDATAEFPGINDSRDTISYEITLEFHADHTYNRSYIIKNNAKVASEPLLSNMGERNTWKIDGQKIILATYGHPPSRTLSFHNALLTEEPQNHQGLLIAYQKTPADVGPGEFYISGPVDHPGVYSLGEGNNTVKHALIKAGLRQPWSEKATLVRRTNESHAVTIPFNPKAILEGKLPDLPLQRQDVLTIEISPTSQPATAPAAAMPTWTDFENLLDQPIDSPSVKAFVERYHLHKYYKFDSGDFDDFEHIPFSLVYDENRIVRIVVTINRTNTSSKEPVYTGDLPHGIKPQDTSETAVHLLGPSARIINGNWLEQGNFAIAFDPSTHKLHEIYLDSQTWPTPHPAVPQPATATTQPAYSDPTAAKLAELVALEEKILADKQGRLSLDATKADIMEQQKKVLEAKLRLEQRLAELSAPSGEFYIMGEIPRTGVYSLTDRKINILQALAAAGGDATKPDGLVITLVRRLPKDKDQIFRLPMQTLVNDRTTDMILQPNDVILIAQNEKLARLLETQIDLRKQLADAEASSDTAKSKDLQTRLAQVAAQIEQAAQESPATQPAPASQPATATPPTRVYVATVRAGDLNVYMDVAGTTEPTADKTAATQPGNCPFGVRFSAPQDELTARMIKEHLAGHKLEVDVYNRGDHPKIIAHGFLVAVDDKYDAATGTLMCRAIVTPSTNEPILGNQAVYVRLLVETRHNVTLIPRAALQYGSHASNFVYVVNADHTISNRTVRTGETDPQAHSVEITAGLSPGEAVVVNNDSLHAGDKVVPEPMPVPKTQLATTTATTQQAQAIPGLAKTFVEQLAAGNYKDAAKPFDDSMLKALPPDKLEKLWNDLAAANGKYLGLAGAVRTKTIDPYTAAYVPTHWQKANLDLKVVFTQDHHITGLWIVKPGED